MRSVSRAASSEGDVRERILRCASELFYKEGVRAVGVDLIVERSGVAKTSLYRYFPTKDALVAAFLQEEDAHFWSCWDQAAAGARGDPRTELHNQLRWIAERVGRDNYRGCPQLNVAAEFADPGHPARLIAKAHKEELLRRLTGIAARLHARAADRLGLQLALLINGAFVSSALLPAGEALTALEEAAKALLVAHGPGRKAVAGHQFR